MSAIKPAEADSSTDKPIEVSLKRNNFGEDVIIGWDPSRVAHKSLSHTLIQLLLLAANERIGMVCIAAPRSSSSLINALDKAKIVYEMKKRHKIEIVVNDINAMAVSDLLAHFWEKEWFSWSAKDKTVDTPNIFVKNLDFNTVEAEIAASRDSAVRILEKVFEGLPVEIVCL